MIEVGNEMFETMLKDASRYQDGLDTPYLVGDAVPEIVTLQLRGDQRSSNDSGADKSAAPSTQTTSSTRTSDKEPALAKTPPVARKPSYEKTYENVEFVTPDSPRAKQPVDAPPATAMPAAESTATPEPAETRPPTLTAPE